MDRGERWLFLTGTEIDGGITLGIGTEFVILAGQDRVHEDAGQCGHGQAGQTDGDPADGNDDGTGVGDTNGQTHDHGGDQHIAALGEVHPVLDHIANTHGGDHAVQHQADAAHRGGRHGHDQRGKLGAEGQHHGKNRSQTDDLGVIDPGQGQNTGVLALSKVYDPKVVRLAAYFAIVLSFCPKFAALIVAMPAATMGGVSLVLYGMISAVGVRNVDENQVDFTKSRNVLIAAMIMGLAVGVPYAGTIIIHLGAITISLSGLAVAAIVGIVMNAVLPGKDYEFGVNEAGDNSVNFGTSAYKDDKKK